MAGPLPVHVNREELHDIAVAPSFEATGSFDVRLVNHGEATHVHLHLDDALSRVAKLEASNHYVDADSERLVSVAVRDGATARGKLKVVSGYGATTRYVDVEVTEPTVEEQSVEVDESLAEPQPTEPEETRLLADNPALAVLSLAGTALALAVGAALVVQQFVVALGAGAVLVGVLVAIYFLLAER